MATNNYRIRYKFSGLYIILYFTLRYNEISFVLSRRIVIINNFKLCVKYVGIFFYEIKKIKNY